MKELYIEAHQELIDAAMEKWEEAHPNATDAEWRAAEARFYDTTADVAYNRMTDKYADMIDRARQAHKDGRL